MEEINDFKHNPILREMLVNYCLRMYEADAIIDDEHLMMEYRLLITDNNLNALHYEEYLINYFNDDNDRG
jgi:hypothetical protein